MNSRIVPPIEPVVLGLALIFGVAIAAVDNVALAGEVSPIVVVAMLLVATSIVAILGSRRPWLPTFAVWVWLPLAHLIKHVLGMPDTLHPNTYASIAMLAAFTLIVALVGMACGTMVRRVVARSATAD